MSTLPLAQVAFTSAVAAGAVSAVAALLASRPLRPLVVGVGTALTGVLGATSGIATILGQSWTADLPGVLPLSGVVLAADPLGAVFLAVAGAVATAAAVYGIGYARHGLDGRTVQAAFPLFVVALLLVPVAGSVATLLVCWELMALTSLLLVVAEHAQRAAVASAGRWYAVMTHLGFVAILAGLLVLAAPAPGDSFAAVRAAAGGLSPATAGLAFVLCLVGFGSKAGIVPLHAWLPRSHPEAPSHVSALMSAAMVTMGVYGIVRVGVDLLGGGTGWWWLLVLALGAVSAVYGILQAVVAADLKRLLAYSTTENMGLVLVGVGASGLFATTGRPLLAALALTAALLHLVGHAAFKTLLFLAAGSVVHATGRPVAPLMTLSAQRSRAAFWGEPRKRQYDEIAG
jgi:formate hydrogenlyase subunit 3/multisubunit Na+/H+ antiporter MnhD subunit